MANYVNSTVFFSGSKKTIVDFLNKGLKGNKERARISVVSSGEEIVAFLNGMERPLSMGSYFPRPKTFDYYDTTNNVKDFADWYLGGCSPNSKTDRHDPLRQKKREEIKSYIQAHPDEFPSPNYSYALERIHPELIPLYRKYVKGYWRARAYQEKKYGWVGWYEWNCSKFGCKWDMPLENWRCEKETGDSLCLSIVMETPWSPAHEFFVNINKIDGVTVYAYAKGDMNDPFVYAFNGRTKTYQGFSPYEDERYIQSEKEINELKKQKETEIQDEDERWKVLSELEIPLWELQGELQSEYYNKVKAEIFAELGL